MRFRHFISAIAVSLFALRGSAGFSRFPFSLSGLLLAGFVMGSTTAHSRTFPQCNDPMVEARLVKDFNWAEKKTWQRGFELASVSRMHEHRTVNHEGSIVTRRYCMGRAHFTNGKHRSIYYMINDRGGFAGIKWGVTHCVSGLDPWRNHDGSCRAIR